jgi:hypothetical protein
MTIQEFQANNHVHGHIHVIVCDNVPIFSRKVLFAMTNNLVKGAISFLHNHHFTFSKCQTYFFEEGSKNMVQNGITSNFI